ncbi:MAG: Uma2 family endonuclease [Longimicrobiales bacterium]
MSSRPAPWISAEEYLQFERSSEQRHEYFAGQVFPMPGGSRKHNLIVGNLIIEIGMQLRGRPCEVYPSTMRVRIPATGLYTYPDVTVLCKTPRLEDSHNDTLLNPTLLIEVLSPSTERYDRGRKAEHYRRIDSLEEYLLVSQGELRIERYARHSDERWLLTEASGIEASLELRSIDCVLALRDVYHKAL